MQTKPLPGVMDDPFHPLSQGCVCHLLFNEGAGSLAYDVSGHGNHGVLKNMLPNTQGSGWAGSKFGGGLAFDGTDDYVTCGSGTSLELGDGSKGTLSFWAKSDIPWADQPNYVSMAQKGNSLGWATGSYQITKWTSTIYFRIANAADAAGVVSVPFPSANEFHFFTLTWDGTTIYAYIDAIEKSSITQTVNATYGGSEPLWIGKSNGKEFNGAIDGVKIYNRALSAEETKQLYYDPFCNMMRVPAWQRYTMAGLSIPVAMHHYEMLRA